MIRVIQKLIEHGLCSRRVAILDVGLSEPAQQQGHAASIESLLQRIDSFLRPSTGEASRTKRIIQLPMRPHLQRLTRQKNAALMFSQPRVECRLSAEQRCREGIVF